MLTVLTQAVIALLHAIAIGDKSSFASPVSQEQVSKLLRKLIGGGLRPLHTSNFLKFQN